MKTKLACAAAVFALAGWTTTPFAYIDGNKYFRTELYTYSVLVLDINGISDIRNPIPVEPGMKVIRVQGPAAPGFLYGDIRELKLDVKPCTRYYLKAVKKNQLEQDFVPGVDYQEPIACCTA